jgi:hypothetical protein
VVVVPTVLLSAGGGRGQLISLGGVNQHHRRLGRHNRVKQPVYITIYCLILSDYIYEMFKRTMRGRFAMSLIDTRASLGLYCPARQHPVTPVVSTDRQQAEAGTEAESSVRVCGSVGRVMRERVHGPLANCTYLTIWDRVTNTQSLLPKQNPLSFFIRTKGRSHGITVNTSHC